MKNKTIKRNKKAGAAVNSGGFGCLFSPALKCKNNNTRKKDYVSKLLIKKFGFQEINIIDKINKLLKSVPNYDKYYLLKNIDHCEPNKLDSEDKQNFDEKCENLNKVNINENNVNANLKNLISINLPYGGITLHEWFYKNKTITSKHLTELNNIIIHMLKNAVIPMSKRNVIHGDIKDKNMLIDDKHDIRIIDWGISGISTKKKVVPIELINRPLQFNTPFSSMIIGEEFIYNYEQFLKKVKNKEISFTEENINTFVINEYLIKLARYYGYYDDNIAIFNILFSDVISKDTYLSEQKKESLLEYGYYLHFFSSYISKILMKFTNNYKFNLKKYVSECYIYNSNIWGLLTLYYNVFFVYHHNRDLFSIDSNILTVYMNQLRDLLVENIFKYGERKINTNNVIKKIKHLNKILKKNKIHKKSHTVKNKIHKKSHTKKNVLSISKF